MVDTNDQVHVALVISKTKVAPIKRLTIPRLELCGAALLADLLYHAKELFDIPPGDVFAWTDPSQPIWFCCEYEVVLFDE